MAKILMKGNHAVGEGAIDADCKAYYGYPITPQNELTAFMAKRMTELNRIFIQAESELAAINMVFGSSLAGARTMTSSSSPGISLKQEGISYLAGCLLPAVIVNIQRGGPGLGNIAGAQGDYFQATRGGGHGDYRTIVLAPHSIQEMYDFTKDAFDLADMYRMGVVVLADGVLGQMLEPMEKRVHGRGSGRQIPNKDWILDGCRKREPRKILSLLMGEGALEKHNLQLQKTYQNVKDREVRYEEYFVKDAEILLAAFGTSARVCKTAVQMARNDGIKLGLIRPITLWPFPEDLFARLAPKVKGMLVVEMNLGQMVEDVKLAVCGKTPVEFYGRSGGGIPEVDEILKLVSKMKK